jgi:hypothetical protein
MPPKYPAAYPDAKPGAAGATTAILVVDDERSVWSSPTTGCPG